MCDIIRKKEFKFEGNIESTRIEIIACFDHCSAHSVRERASKQWALEKTHKINKLKGLVRDMAMMKQ